MLTVLKLKLIRGYLKINDNLKLWYYLNILSYITFCIN